MKTEYKVYFYEESPVKIRADYYTDRYGDVNFYVNRPGLFRENERVASFRGVRGIVNETYLK